MLVDIGKFVNDNDIRLTFHPGQYNVVGTPRREVYEQTIRDLMYHADVLEKLGTKDAVMVVHGGGVYGNKKET